MNKLEHILAQMEMDGTPVYWLYMQLRPHEKFEQLSTYGTDNAEKPTIEQSRDRLTRTVENFSKSNPFVVFRIEAAKSGTVESKRRFNLGEFNLSGSAQQSTNGLGAVPAAAASREDMQRMLDQQLMLARKEMEMTMQQFLQQHRYEQQQAQMQAALGALEAQKEQLKQQAAALQQRDTERFGMTEIFGMATGQILNGFLKDSMPNLHGIMNGFDSALGSISGNAPNGQQQYQQRYTPPPPADGGTEEYTPLETAMQEMADDIERMGFTVEDVKRLHQMVRQEHEQQSQHYPPYTYPDETDTEE